MLIMKNTLKVVALGVAVTLACYALQKMGSQVIGVLGTVNWALVAFSVIGLTVYQWLNAGTWKDVFAGLGIKVSRSVTARLWIKGESMKWLPGGIWGYGSRVSNARKLGVDLCTASSALAVELLLTVVAWFFTSLWILPTAIGRNLTSSALTWVSHSSWMAWTVCGGGALSIFLIPKARILFIRIVSRVLPSMKGMKFQPQDLVRAVVSYFTLCLLNGTLLWLVTLSVPGIVAPWASVIGIGGTAWLIGFFAVGVPGGIGVREAVLAGLLTSYGPMESAVAVAVVFRAAQVIAELVALGGSLLFDLKCTKNALADCDSTVLG